MYLILDWQKRALAVIFFLILSGLSSVSVLAETGCGKPTGVDEKSRGIYLWQECGTRVWILHAVGGGRENDRYKGKIQSSTPFVWVDENGLESHDDVVLEDEGKRLVFNLLVWKDSDTLSFKVASADTQFKYTFAKNGFNIVVGEEKLEFSPGDTFDLDTLANIAPILLPTILD